MHVRFLTDRRRGLWLLIGLLAALPLLCGCPKERTPEDYREQLGSENSEKQRRAVEELTRMQERALPILEPALESPDEGMRIGALKVLAKVRRMSSIRMAGELLDAPEKKVRLQTIDTISQLAGLWKERSTELLAEALKQEDPECVKKAAQSLMQMGYEDATAALKRATQPPDTVRAVYAARYLHEMDPSEETAGLLLENLMAGDEQARTAAEESVKELADGIIESLVRFADEHSDNDRVQQILVTVRDKLIEELNKILDSKRAAAILDALATIADQTSVTEIINDLEYSRLESRWRIAAASALGKAARSPRSGSGLETRIHQALEAALENERMDNRVRIGAAIALCRLRSEKGVDFLLEMLDAFQERTRGAAQISAAQLQGLTEARIRAQEALTASGDFVVPGLLARLRQEKPGPIIVWAAAKTLGELSVQEAVPLLRPFILREREPVATAPAEGEEPPVSPITIGPEGELSEPVGLENWSEPTEEDVARLQERLEKFAYPGYVRWTVAVALGRIGGEEALEILQKAAAAEREFLGRLRANKDLPDHYRRAPVIEGLIRRHEDVLFYIERPLEEGGGAAT